MLELDLTNSKCYGTYCVSLCATYFLAQDYQVLMPYGDRGHYDLVTEKGGVFQRVQCKWTSHTRTANEYPLVGLKVHGSAKKDGTIKTEYFYTYKIGDFDLLWVTTPQTCYLIPLADILVNKETVRGLKLFPKWDKYRVAVPIPFPSDESPVKRASPRLTDEDKAVIRRLRAEGRTQQDIANVLSVTRACIEKFLLRDAAASQ